MNKEICNDLKVYQNITKIEDIIELKEINFWKSRKNRWTNLKKC